MLPDRANVVDDALLAVRNREPVDVLPAGGGTVADVAEPVRPELGRLEALLQHVPHHSLEKNSIPH